MDGVITDCSGAFARAFGYHTNMRPRVYDLSQFLGVSWGAINFAAKRPGFWRNMSPLPWGAALVSYLTKRYDVFILSHPWDNHPACYAEKVEWCMNFGIPADRVILSKFKHILAGHDRILIDDLMTNCQKWQLNGGKAINFPAYHNNYCEMGTEPTTSEVISAVESALDLVQSSSVFNLHGNN